MKNKDRSITNYTYGVNIAQFALCFAVFLLRLNNLFENNYIQFVCGAVEILIWFTFGLMYSIGLNVRNAGKSLAFPLLSLLPIILVTGAAFGIGYFLTDEFTVSWGQFFFIGSAVNFYHKPCVFIASFLPADAYIVYGVNIGIMFLISYFGTVTGVISNNSAAKKKAKRNAAKQAKKTDNAALKSGENVTAAAEEVKPEAKSAKQLRQEKKKEEKRKKELAKLEKEQQKLEKKKNKNNTIKPEADSANEVGVQQSEAKTYEGGNAAETPESGTAATKGGAMHFDPADDINNAETEDVLEFEKVELKWTKSDKYSAEDYEDNDDKDEISKFESELMAVFDDPKQEQTDDNETKES